MKKTLALLLLCLSFQTQILQGEVLPVCGTDNAGNTLSIWTTPSIEGSDKYICAATLSNSGSWDAPVVIADHQEDTYRPLLAVNGTGDALVMYSIQNSSFQEREVYVVEYVSGTWGTPIKLSPSNTSQRQNFYIHLNDQNRAIVAWQAVNRSTGAVIEYFADTTLGSTWNITTLP